MWYRFDVVIPAGTTEAAPVRREIRLPAGIITGVRIRYPPGPRGTVSVAIFQGGHKMFPRGYELPAALPDRPGPPSWFVGDDEAVLLNEHVETIEGWHWFLEGFSPMAAYPHRVYVDIFVLEKEFAQPLDPVRELVEQMRRLIGL